MARRGFYGFERRRRVDAQRAKQEAKRRRRTERAEAGTQGPEMGEAPATGPAPGVWEWFSPSRGLAATSPPNGRPDRGEPDDWVLLTEVEPEPGPEP